MAKETFERSKPRPLPPPPPPGNVTGGTIELTAGVLTTFDIDFDGGDTDGIYWIASATPPRAQGTVSVPETQLKWLKSVNNLSLAGVVSLMTEYSARIGTPPLGSKVFVRMDRIDTDSGKRWHWATIALTVTGT